MSRDDKKFIPIRYTHREFGSIRDDLLEMAERFYPEDFQDFSDSSFGAMMIDAAAYVGDQLSLYLDYNVNESFLDTSFQRTNILRHGRALGYKEEGRPSTYGTVALYAMIPAEAVGIGPDSRYIPILKRGSRLASQTGLSFILTDNVDFSDPKYPIVVARVNNDTGAPTHYAIKAYGNVVSGRLNTKVISVGSYVKFRRVLIPNTNISEIIKVVDTQGNEFFEVDYLAQDVIFKEIPNKNFKNDNVPSVIKPKVVTNKFVVERTQRGVVLQFGGGQAGASNVVATPQSVAIDVFGKSYITDTTFDPTTLSKNKALGVSPSNTELTIVYRENNPTNSNISAGSLNIVSNAILEFDGLRQLDNSKVAQVRTSIEVSNEQPITGDTSNPSKGEIKRRIMDTFPTQNRAVTQADYENLAYRMHPKFGSIKRCSVQKDASSIKRNLNMYVISENEFGKLSKTNDTVKKNLKTWLNSYRMINDTVDILDPYIINLGIDFVVKTVATVDKTRLMSECLSAIKERYSDEAFFIGEHFSISDVYAVLKNVDDVLDVIKVKINNKSGGNYSQVNFDINKNLSPAGDMLVCPKNAIFEIKFFETDIKGKIR